MLWKSFHAFLKILCNRITFGARLDVTSFVFIIDFISDSLYVANDEIQRRRLPLRMSDRSRIIFAEIGSI